MAEESYFNQYVVNPIQNAFTSLTKGEDLSGLPYEAQAAALAKRQKLAELLMQQGQQQPEVLTYKGIAAQPSVAGGLGKALSQFMGAYMGGKADENLANATAAEKKAVNDERARIFGMNPAVAATPLSQGAYQGVDAEGIPSYDVNLPTPAKAASYILQPEEQREALDVLSGRSSFGEKAAARGLARVDDERARAEAKALRDRPVYRANTEYGGSVVDPNTQEVIKSFAPSPVKPSNKTPFAAVVNGKPGMFVYNDAGQLEAVPGMTPFRTGGGDGGEKAPSGYRSDGKGGLAFIPGGPADPGNKAKPPSQAFLRLETDDLKDVQLAGSIASDLDAFAKKIDEGKMTLGPIANIGSKIELATGMANQNAKEIGSFKTSLEKLRNDSLRLNKGTQTEGDAVRAFNELFQNINDQGFVRQRLDEIKKINRRAQAQRVMTVNDRRELSGYNPIDESKYLTQPSAYESPAAKNTGGAGGAGPANLPPGTVYSPSRKQYRDPSGKLYDQNGKPL